MSQATSDTPTFCWHNWRAPNGYCPAWGGERCGCHKPDGHRASSRDSDGYIHTCKCGNQIRR